MAYCRLFPWQTALLLGVVILLVPAAGGATTGTLTEALGATPPDRLIELRLSDDELMRGYLVVVRDSTVFLRPEEMDGPLTSCALDRIINVYEWRANTGRGAAWGATSGAAIVGSLGVLLGTYLASINSSDESDVGPIVGMTLLSAGVGALGGGVLGLGVGALSRSWHAIWPNAGPSAGYRPPPHSEATRLGLFAGTARPLLEGYEVSRFAARMSLRKNVGRVVSLGPEISFHKFEGSRLAQSEFRTYTDGKENLLKVALVVNLHRRRAGLSPYATTGCGWFISNDAYLGAHLGGGLRWQFRNHNDLEFDIRYHFNLSNVDRGEVDRFWTLGVGLGFDL